LHDLPGFSGSITKTEIEKMILNDKEDCAASLNACLTRTASWRRGMQSKYPSDERNGRAAATLDRFATEANDLPDEAWAELKSYFNWVSPTWSDAVSEAVRLVEFRNVNTFPAFTKALVLASLFASQRTLKSLAPQFKWAGLGNLLGDYEEFIATEVYGLQQAPRGANGYDAISDEGKKVQVKSHPTVAS
jgi:hypothetical protein